MSREGHSEVREKKTVLVIDDDPIALEVIARVLRHSGFSVRQLTTPIGATRMAIRNEIDAVVFDFEMPAMRGDKLAALFRSSERLSRLPLIVVSAESPERLRESLAGLPNVRMVPKSQVQTDLGPLLHHAIANSGRRFTASG